MKNTRQSAGAYATRVLIILIVYSFFLNRLLSDNQIAKAASAGEKLYGLNCAACHKDGHNIVNPKKPVIGSAKLNNKQTFKDYLLKPTGAMAPYPAIANNDADLTALYNYCKSLK